MLPVDVKSESFCNFVESVRFLKIHFKYSAVVLNNIKSSLSTISTHLKIIQAWEE